VPAATVADVLSRGQVLFSVLAITVTGSVGLAGALAHRWRMEWVAASALFFLLLARAVPVWVTLDDVPSRLAAAAMMTLGAVGVGRRALDMWIFWHKTTRASRRHRLWRTSRAGAT